MFSSKWEVWRTIWPYPEGWGVYHPATRTLLDSGLEKNAAQEIADDLNKRRVKPGSK